MIPFILAIAFSILLALMFLIPGLFLFVRWLTIFITDDSYCDIGDTKVPTFYSTETKGDHQLIVTFCMPVVGVVFGGIHCIGWFFNFPSSDEAMLWRVSSAVLTGIAFLLPIFMVSVSLLLNISNSVGLQRRDFAVAVFSIILLLYVVSRLLLLVEAFISLRHLTPGMFALVKWTSFIPHI